MPKILERRTVRISRKELSQAMGVEIASIIESKPFGNDEEDGVQFTIDIESTLPFFSDKKALSDGEKKA